MVIILFLSLLAWAPLLYPGFIQTHSGLGAVYDALSAGGPFSGWLPAYGAAGDGPLATWLLVVLKAAVGPLAALKVLYISSFMLAGVGMSVLARRMWGERPALVAAAVYLFIPYRLATVYVRGALAEALLLGLAPFFFLALLDARETPRWRSRLAIALLALAFVLLNVGLAVLLVVSGLLWCATTPSSDGVTWSVIRRRAPSALAAGVGMLIGLLIMGPASDPLLANGRDWQDHLVYFYQLFAPAWGFGESGAGWQDGLSFQIGLAPAALTIVALWLAHETNDATLRRAVLQLCALAGVLVGLTLTAAAPLWRIVPLSAFLAYPWQLLGLAALPLALLAGAAAHALSRAPAAQGNTHTRPYERPQGKGGYSARSEAMPDGAGQTLTADSRSSEIASSLGSAPRNDQEGESGSGASGDGRAEGSTALPPNLGLTTLAVVLAFVVLASYGFLAPRFMNEADLPDLSHAPLAQLGDEVLLLDARVDGDLRPGGMVKLTMIWQALRQPSADYTVFVHLLDRQGVKRGQQDALPQQGARPTSGWQRGEVVRDEIAVPIAADAPAGDYRLSVGMYLLATLERLPVGDNPERAHVIEPVTIR
jgi:hypothetical protein